MLRHIFAASLLYVSGIDAILARQADEAVAVTINAPSPAPANASLLVDTDFAGFAFEERSFYYYFGTPDNPNNFSLNLLNAITAKTKTKPNIRVGGSSLDDSQYDPNQIKPIKNDDGSGIPNNMTFGPSYFNAFATIPNARYVIDIPMKKNNLQNSQRFAKDAYQKIGAANIAALEIGNEPNNYKGKTTAEYVKQWKNWSAQILDTLGLSADTAIYQAVCMGSETGETGFPGGTPDSPKIRDYFEADQGLKTIRSRIKTVSMHYYQTKANNESDLQTDIMNHNAVVRGSAFVKDAVKYLKTLDPVIPLALAETGSVLGNGSDTSPLENVLGSALWQVDFFLYSMSIDVKRINLQSGLTFPFALWNPEFQNGEKTVPASVHAAFYGQIFAAEFRGDGDNVKVWNQDLDRPFLSAYMAYDSGKLGRVAIVNLELWSQGDTPTRPKKDITLQVGNSAKSVEIKRLTAVNGGTAKPSNITWGGEQWTADSGGEAVQVLNDTTTVAVDNNGKVQFSVKASEAVMLFVKY